MPYIRALAVDDLLTETAALSLANVLYLVFEHSRCFRMLGIVEMEARHMC